MRNTKSTVIPIKTTPPSVPPTTTPILAALEPFKSVGDKDVVAEIVNKEVANGLFFVVRKSGTIVTFPFRGVTVVEPRMDSVLFASPFDIVEIEVEPVGVRFELAMVEPESGLEFACEPAANKLIESRRLPTYIMSRVPSVVSLFIEIG
jgi:hypothetical protein